MEFEKLTVEEIRGFEAVKRKEVEIDLRATLAKNKLNILSEQNKHTASSRKLKRNLARLLTVKNECRTRNDEH